MCAAGAALIRGFHSNYLKASPQVSIDSAGIVMFSKLKQRTIEEKSPAGAAGPAGRKAGAGKELQVRRGARTVYI